MKKIIMISVMVTMLLGFGGCFNNDEAYIETVKGLTFDNGDTVEDIVKYKLTGTGLAIMNHGVVEKIDNFFVFNETGEYVLASSYASKEIAEIAKRANYTSIDTLPPLNWEVEGETNNGKVIIATSKYGKVMMTTIDNGDYVSINLDNIEQVNYNESYVSDETIASHVFLNNIMKSN